MRTSIFINDVLYWKKVAFLGLFSIPRRFPGGKSVVFAACHGA
jgi:hypothetical protein